MNPSVIRTPAERAPATVIGLPLGSSQAILFGSRLWRRLMHGARDTPVAQLDRAAVS